MICNHKVLRGIIHDNVIELMEDAGISDGEQVEVIVRRVVPQARQPGDGFRRTKGALADDASWDAIMKKVQRGRKQERRSQQEDT